MAKSRANDWGSNDDTEDGYLDQTKPDNEGYENDPTEKSTPVSTRAPLSYPFTQGGIWFKKSVNRKEGQPFFKPLNGKILSDSDHTITLNIRHVLRKSDLALKIKQPRAPNKIANRMNTLVNVDDLAAKRKRHSPAKRLVSNIVGPSSFRRTLETQLLRDGNVTHSRQKVSSHLLQNQRLI